METAELKAGRETEVEGSAKRSSLKREGGSRTALGGACLAECGVAVYVSKGAGVTQCGGV